MTITSSGASSPGGLVAWPMAILPSFVLDGCWTATRTADTATFTHAWWTGPAFAIAFLAACAWGARLWRRGDQIKGAGFTLIWFFLAATLGPKHVTEYITVSSQGVAGRTGTWWWQPDIWTVKFENYSEVIPEEVRELTATNGQGEIKVERSLWFVPKDKAAPLSLPVNGLLRDSKAGEEILRRARDAGLNTDPDNSLAVKKRKDFNNALRKKFGFPPLP
jgi:hypothetical protein